MGVKKQIEKTAFNISIFLIKILNGVHINLFADFLVLQSLGYLGAAALFFSQE